MTDLEHAVREMLREHATDIRTAPDWLADLDHATSLGAPDQVRDGRIRRYLLVAAAIALVAAVGVGIGHLVHRHGAPPATNPTSIPSERRSSCPATLPGSWPRTGTAVVAGSEQPLFLAATPDGGAIVDRYDGTTRDVALVRTGSVRSLFTVEQPEAYEAVNATVDGDWAAVTIGYHVTTDFLPVELDLVNLRTGERRVVDRLSAADIRARTNAILGAGIAGGRVYWGVGTFAPDVVHEVRVYDIATARVSTDPRSTAPGKPVTSVVQASAFGVIYQTPRGTVAVPRQLPGAIAAAVRRDGSTARSTLVTDGSAYAWLATPDHLAWWQPGQRAVSVYRETRAIEQGGLLVAGPYLIYDTVGGSTVVMDARTGASATAPSQLTYRGAGAGILWSSEPSAAPGFRTVVYVDDVARLPELRCS